MCKVTSPAVCLAVSFFVVGFGSDEIVVNRFSFSVCTNMKCISDGHTGQANPSHVVSLGGPQDSLDAQGLTSRPPAFSAIRSRTEGGPAEGGVKRILGVNFGAEWSLYVWKQ